MKRAFAALQRDEREHQEDELLRAQLQREEAAAASEKQKKMKEEKYAEKWKGYLAKWDEHALQSASGRKLTLPVPDPPGTFVLLEYFYSDCYYIFRSLVDIGTFGPLPQ